MYKLKDHIIENTYLRIRNCVFETREIMSENNEGMDSESSAIR